MSSQPLAAKPTDAHPPAENKRISTALPASGRTATHVRARTARSMRQMGKPPQCEIRPGVLRNELVSASTLLGDRSSTHSACKLLTAMRTHTPVPARQINSAAIDRENLATLSLVPPTRASAPPGRRIVYGWE